jgi:hypothetical protein
VKTCSSTPSPWASGTATPATAACDPFIFRLPILVFKIEQSTTIICSVLKNSA